MARLRVVRLALVQADLGAPAHVGVRGPVDHEQGAFDATDFPQGRRHLVLARIHGELAHRDQNQALFGKARER